MNKISTNWWFDGEAEKAAAFYTSLFPRSRITEVVRYPDSGRDVHGRNAGSVMTVYFELDGSSFVALNGGPIFALNPSISLFASYPATDEIDRLWEQLSKGGRVHMPIGEYPFSKRYGWIEDRFGVSWQLMRTEHEMSQHLVPCVLFTGKRCGQARAAIEFYTSVFSNAKEGFVSTYGPGQEPNGTDLINFADFELEGQHFHVMESALDHPFDLNEATSFVVSCRDQPEIDHYWEKLSAVPEAEQCGWLKDRFGVSWQIVPTATLNELMGNAGDRARARVMSSLLKMKKLDIEGLRKAAGE